MQLKDERTIIFGNLKGGDSSVEQILGIAEKEDISQIVTLGRFSDSHCTIHVSQRSKDEVAYRQLVDWAESSRGRVWIGLLMNYDEVADFVFAHKYLSTNSRCRHVFYNHDNLFFSHYDFSLKKKYRRKIKAWEEGPKINPLLFFYAHSYFIGYDKEYPNRERNCMHLGDNDGGSLEIPIEDGFQYWISTGPNKRSYNSETSYANFGIHDPDRKLVELRSIPYMARSVDLS